MKEERVNGSGRGRALVRPVLIALGAAVVTFAAPSLAQQQPGLDAWQRGSCTACHGSLAQGGGGGEMPAGPNLRRTRLTPAELKETIACGRGDMPYHLEAAYATVPCYGIPVPGPAGAALGAPLTAAEIDALVDFLTKEVVGVTTITRAACAVFFNGNANAPACAQYR